MQKEALDYTTVLTIMIMWQVISLLGPLTPLPHPINISVTLMSLQNFDFLYPHAFSEKTNKNLQNYWPIVRKISVKEQKIWHLRSIAYKIQSLRKNFTNFQALRLISSMEV